MSVYKKLWFLFIFCLIVFSIVGCKTLDETKTLEGTHQIRDSTGAVVQVPDNPTRVVPIGVSTEDMVISLVGPQKIVALGNLPNNFPEESKQIKAKVKLNTEAVLALHPDLLIVPDWVDQEMVVTLRGLNFPVYVYKGPRTIDGSEKTILELADLLNQKSKGEAIVNSMQQRLVKVAAFTEQVKSRKIVGFYGVLGLTGGIGSTFDNMTQLINAANAAALLGLDISESGTREDLIRINPDVIIVPSNVYSFDQYKEIEVTSLYSDPALKDVKAVKNHQIYVIDARWIMSYSQFMINGIEELARVTYGYSAK